MSILVVTMTGLNQHHRWFNSRKEAIDYLVTLDSSSIIAICEGTRLTTKLSFVEPDQEQKSCLKKPPTQK